MASQQSLQGLHQTFSFSDSERQVWHLDPESIIPLWDGTRFEKKQFLARADRNQAEVWSYFDQQTQTHCAVKNIPLWVVQYYTATNDTEQPWADSFIDEHLSQTSGSPHFIRWLGRYKDATHVYFVTELATRGDLWHFLQSVLAPTPERPRPSETEYNARLSHYMRQVLEAVAELHSMGIAHNDLSIENVLVRDDHTVALVDFGMALRLRTGDGGAFLPVHRTRGKATYWAPEVFDVHDGRARSYQAIPAEVYTVGIMLLFLAVTPILRHYPWDLQKDDTEGFIVFQQYGLNGLLHFYRIDSLRTDLINLLNRMLHRDPLQRPTAQECVTSPFFQTHTGTEAPSSPANPQTASLGGGVAGGVQP